MTEAASATAPARQRRIADFAQFETLRTSLPADVLTQLDAWLAPSPLDLEDEADDDGGPLADPVIQAAHAAWRHEGHRAFNMREAEAIAWAAKVPLKVAVDCSAALYRLGGGVYWQRTQKQWADDLTISVDMVAKVFSILFDTLRLVRRRIVGCNVATYTRNDEAIAALTYAYGEASGVDWQGYAPRFGQNAGTVKQATEPGETFHGLGKTPKRFCQNAGTRIQGLTQSKTPAAPPPDAAHNERSREPGEDDEPTPTPQTSANAAEMLTAFCAANDVTHKAAVITLYTSGNNVTQTEAAQLIARAHEFNGGDGEPVRNWKWFEAELSKLRDRRGNARHTPVGGHANPADTLRVLRDLDSAGERLKREKDDPAKVERAESSLSAALAAAHAARSRARYRS